MSFTERMLFYLSQYRVNIGLTFIFAPLLSYAGLFLVLRRSSLFGLVISQGAKTALLAATVILPASIHSGSHAYNHPSFILDSVYLGMVIVILLPIFYLLKQQRTNSETLLAILLVLFTSMLPLINAASGLTDAFLVKVFFNEIFYTEPGLFFHYLPYVLLLSTLLFIFRKPVFLSGFDPVQAQLTGLKPSVYNMLFYLIITLLIAVTLRIMGVYFAIAIMLLPAMLALRFFRTMLRVTVATTGFSLLMTFSAFGAALLLDSLPSEPVMTVTIVMTGALITSVHRLFTEFRQSGRL